MLQRSQQHDYQTISVTTNRHLSNSGVLNLMAITHSTLLKKFGDIPAALIFDLDGTLLDTEPLYTTASQRVLDPYDQFFSPELKKKCIGRDSRQSAQMTIDHAKLPMTVDEYLAAREVHLRTLFKNPPDISYAEHFVTAAKQTKIPLGLATSSHQHLCELKLSKKRWASEFDQIICGDHPLLSRGKPEPDIFLLCASKLGVTPDKCIAFEDSPAGVQAATSAGMKVIAISSPYVDAKDLGDAEVIINGYDELNDLIEHWQKHA
jgi:pseudouridine-5'-monophosphatase